MIFFLEGKYNFPFKKASWAHHKIEDSYAMMTKTLTGRFAPVISAGVGSSREPVTKTRRHCVEKKPLQESNASTHSYRRLWELLRFEKEVTWSW